MSTSLGNVASYSSCLVADGDCGYQKLCEGFEIAFFSAPPSFQNCSVGTTMVTRKEVAFYFIQKKNIVHVAEVSKIHIHFIRSSA